MGSLEKKLRRQAALRAAKARAENRPQMSLEESLDALSGGIQEAFVRIQRLDETISEVLEEHVKRLDTLERRLRILIDAHKKNHERVVFCEECSELIPEFSQIHFFTDDKGVEHWWHLSCWEKSGVGQPLPEESAPPAEEPQRRDCLPLCCFCGHPIKGTDIVTDRATGGPAHRICHAAQTMVPKED